MVSPALVLLVNASHFRSLKYFWCFSEIIFPTHMIGVVPYTLVMVAGCVMIYVPIIEAGKNYLGNEPYIMYVHRDTDVYVITVINVSFLGLLTK